MNIKFFFVSLLLSSAVLTSAFAMDRGDMSSPHEEEENTRNVRPKKEEPPVDERPFINGFLNGKGRDELGGLSQFPPEIIQFIFNRVDPIIATRINSTFFTAFTAYDRTGMWLTGCDKKPTYQGSWFASNFKKYLNKVWECRDPEDERLQSYTNKNGKTTYTNSKNERVTINRQGKHITMVNLLRKYTADTIPSFLWNSHFTRVRAPSIEYCKHLSGTNIQYLGINSCDIKRSNCGKILRELEQSTTPSNLEILSLELNISYDLNPLLKSLKANHPKLSRLTLTGDFGQPSFFPLEGTKIHTLIFGGAFRTHINDIIPLLPSLSSLSPIKNLVLTDVTWTDYNVKSFVTVLNETKLEKLIISFSEGESQGFSLNKNEDITPFVEKLIEENGCLRDPMRHEYDYVHDPRNIDFKNKLAKLGALPPTPLVSE